MPGFSFVVPHSLEPAEVMRRLRERSDAVKEAYQAHLADFEETWESDSLACRFHTMGQKFQGTLKAMSGEVQIQMSLPIMAMMFRGMIESKVREELGKLFA
jgi:hypothetical protein